MHAQGCHSVSNASLPGVTAGRGLSGAAAVLLAAVLSACAPTSPSITGAVVTTGEAPVANSASGAQAAAQAVVAVAPPPVALDQLPDPVEAVEDALEVIEALEWPEVDQSGVASWYGPGFHGRKTANGERYNQYELTAAHRKYAFNTQLCVRNAGNGKTVVVRVNDRGPYAGKRVIDLSKAAAEEIGMLKSGVKHVEIYKLDEGEESCPQALLQAAAPSRG